MDNPLVRLEPGLFIWTVITFLVLLAALAKFVWKPLMAALDRRESRIRQSLAEAEKARQEAEKVSREYDEMIGKARAEVQAIVAEGKSAAEKLREKVVQQARVESDRIRAEAEKRIQAEKESAIAEIREEVVNLSIQAAAKIIGRNLTREDNVALIQKSLDKMDKAANA